MLPTLSRNTVTIAMLLKLLTTDLRFGSKGEIYETNAVEVTNRGNYSVLCKWGTDSNPY